LIGLVNRIVLLVVKLSVSLTIKLGRALVNAQGGVSGETIAKRRTSRQLSRGPNGSPNHKGVHEDMRRTLIWNRLPSIQSVCWAVLSAELADVAETESSARCLSEWYDRLAFIDTSTYQ